MSCPKQNGPLCSGPFVVEFRGLISWPVRAPGLAQEPVRAQGLVLAQAPGLVQERAGAGAGAGAGSAGFIGSAGAGAGAGVLAAGGSAGAEECSPLLPKT